MLCAECPRGSHIPTIRPIATRTLWVRTQTHAPNGLTLLKALGSAGFPGMPPEYYHNNGGPIQKDKECKRGFYRGYISIICRLLYTTAPRGTDLF